MVEASASIEISSAKEGVWALIKPASTAKYFHSSLLHGFRVPGTPEGLGEMQCFIFKVGDREKVSVIEIVEYVHQELAVIRELVTDDPAARSFFKLTSCVGGTTYECTDRFTISAEQVEHKAQIIEHRRNHILDHLALTKDLVENGWQKETPPDLTQN
ncbi:hypothetical protein FHU41_002147 [Psychromicrobium silvestre]|uniref:Polyketide cyclase / dehydrase and lipid transport n=1 Tax=Psychromicrobium silvestre TaxID=1645614 RepID=A0A7Y9LUM9_9MICC|nr:hypothetical protein [Psychromicrobium silvestre]NYE95897.1 hypothetical protein [Psychromicrobium silvestre]